MKIYPSLTSQSITELQEQISLLSPYVEGFHIDFMDGQFVPATMGSIEVINQIRSYTSKQLWIHLMAQDPFAIIKQLNLNTNDRITFHAESTQDYQSIITYLQDHTIQPSLALNPLTPLHVLINTLYSIKHITVMSVEPGASGQPFLGSTWQKIKDLQAFRTDQHHYITIAVDGGVTEKNIIKLAIAGVNEVVMHHGLFDTPDPAETIKKLLLLLETSHL